MKKKKRRGTVEVRSSSARREAIALLPIALAIGFVALFVARGPCGASDRSPQAGLLAHQKRFRDLAPGEQRIFRELQEGIAEAEGSRSSVGRWPIIEELASTGVPPFVPAPRDRDRWSWEFRESNEGANYLGLPRSPTDSAWLVLLQESGERVKVELGEKIELDEFHRQLSDGTLIHVSTWMRTGPPKERSEEVIARPETAGWTQIVIGPEEPS